MTRLWIGTYPVAGQGTATGCGEGIWSTELDLGSGRLGEPRQVVETPAPSFLALPDAADRLYAVNESIDGALSTFRAASHGLDLLATTPTGGAHPCHLVLDPVTRAVVIANYTSGSLSLIEVDVEGVPAHGGPDQVLAFTGSGPDAARQATAHAHFVFAPPNHDALLVTDLGADVVRRLRRDATARRLVEDGVAVALPPGSGPRHAAFAPDGRHLYVAAELDGRLHTVAWDPSTASGRVTASAAVCSATAGIVEPSHVTADAGGILVGVRGADVLTRHRLVDDGATELLADDDLPGSWPRHHAVVGRWVVVALQRGNRVAVLDRSGRLVDEVALPSPACVVAERGHGTA